MSQPNPRKKYIHQFKEPARQDPFRSKSKPRGSPRCPVCHAVSLQGRWVTAPVPKKAAVEEELICPSCEQLKENYALGVVEIKGDTWREKEELILNMIRHTEQIARHRNNQERILWIKETKTTLKIYVTLPELARQIGRELEKSFQGNTEYEHSNEESYLRVRWNSDEKHMKHRPGSPLKSKRPLLQKSKAFRTRSHKA